MSSDLSFLFQALVVVILPLAVLRCGRLRTSIPLVVVQIATGIALGPSLFGRFAPTYFEMVFNHQALERMSGIAAVAVLFFGLTTGLHLKLDNIRNNTRSFGVLAAASLGVPTALGFLVGLWIAARWPEQLGVDVTPVEFAEAIGICTGVTAVPVLGAILYEMDLLRTRIGEIALGIAGLSDGTLWIFLGLLWMTHNRPAAEQVPSVANLLALPLYLVLMVGIVRPLLRRAVVGQTSGAISEGAIVLVYAMAISSALLTQMLGLHYVLGAFVAGAITPRELREAIVNQLQVVTISLLMPFFFLITGLRSHIDFAAANFLEIFILATAAAVVGKIGATTLAARMVGESWATGVSLGGLLQTKGLMEVVVLTILLDGGIISVSVFSALVLMGVVSTALTMPLVRLTLPGRQTRMLYRKSGVDGSLNSSLLSKASATD